MCIRNQMVVNRKYTETKKNGGVIPLLKDERTLYVPRGCGDCSECRKQKARQWQVRLMEDIKTKTNGKFVTLTFSNESIAKIILGVHTDGGVPINEILTGYDMDNFIATYAMRKFNERYRKRYGEALRHWMITELGHQGTENIHMHGIVWTDRGLQRIEQLWKYGYIWPRTEEHIRKNYVSTRTVSYMTKYVTKVEEKHKYYKPVILASPGIGANYVKTYNATRNKYNGTETRETYRTPTGHKISMPVYWRNKIYSDEEREQLWIQKLDKEERWVKGEKVDISKGDAEYKELVKYYQQKDIQMGYIGKRDWKEEDYEKKRRTLMQLTRIKKGNKKSPSAGS